ncbi:MAG: hypothetical protein LQ352_008020 [Teloschistes flavicans]|nr:MAG: hypothetical protein LQ352_008020 [Teloschistes flavicans]
MAKKLQENTRVLLPGMLSGKNAYAATDFASYTDVWWAIIQLYQLCTLNYQTPGWVPIGLNSSTGVLLYPSNSTVDRQINGTHPTASLAEHVPSGWTYNGCNVDNPQARALGNLSWSGIDLSLQRCADYCEGYTYMGVLNSNSAVGGEKACDTMCNGGEDDEICGGVRALSVYQRIGYGGINT